MNAGRKEATVRTKDIRRMHHRGFICTVCGTKRADLFKFKGKTAIGHEKHAWCYQCKERTMHVQVE